MALVIGILGAESTGKSDLAQALADRARALGIATAVVPEYLREFCEQAGRTPVAAEQHHIAAEQTRRIDAASRAHALVLADTTALMTAVYSEYIFGDAGLYEAALRDHQRCDRTLLTGLDMPWQPDGLQRDGPHVRAPVDALLRQHLHTAGVAFSVVYGQGQARIDAGWRLVLRHLQQSGLVPDAPPPQDTLLAGRNRLRPMCRECLVPECEHLGLGLSQLVRGR